MPRRLMPRRLNKSNDLLAINQSRVLSLLLIPILGSQSEGVAPLSSTALRSSPFLPTPPPLPQPSQGVLSPYEEQDLRLERSGLSKPDLKAVRCWRQTFHGANRILREHTSKKWSRRQLLKSFAAPVQPREQYMTLDRLDVACTTVQRAKGSDIQELGSRARPIGPLETAATVEFFQANTFVRSGAKTLTRRMALSKCELYGLYRAHYPMICRRAESLAQAEMYGPMCNHLSTQLVIAKKMSRVPGWSAENNISQHWWTTSRRTGPYSSLGNCQRSQSQTTLTGSRRGRPIHFGTFCREPK